MHKYLINSAYGKNLHKSTTIPDIQAENIHFSAFPSVAVLLTIDGFTFNHTSDHSSICFEVVIVTDCQQYCETPVMGCGFGRIRILI